LEITAADTVLDCRRDPVEVCTFHIDVPEGKQELAMASPPRLRTKATLSSLRTC
jgi:hypothetical protein